MIRYVSEDMILIFSEIETDQFGFTNDGQWFQLRGRKLFSVSAYAFDGKPIGFDYVKTVDRQFLPIWIHNNFSGQFKQV